MYGHTHQDDKQERGYRVLNVRLNPDLHQTIHRLARQSGESIASTIRSLLRASVEQAAK